MVRVSKPNPASVRATFESVAHRYDLANHVLSGGIDFIWRKKLVEWALKEIVLKYWIWQLGVEAWRLHCVKHYPVMRL